VRTFGVMVCRWSAHGLMSLPFKAALAVLVWCSMSWLALAQPPVPSAEPQAPSASAWPSSIGREVAVPVHLQDGQEFSLPLDKLLAHGLLLFNANWTEQEGGGRPLTKGTGRPVADPSRPLTGRRAFNRVSGPDANSCFGCHNAPHGLSGGGGDFVTNVFVLGQRFDFVTFDPADTLPTLGTIDETGQAATLHDAANFRATTGLFGSGYLEMLARQITEEPATHPRYHPTR